MFKKSAGQKLFEKNVKEIKQEMLNEVGYIYCQRCFVNLHEPIDGHHIVFRSEKPDHPHLHDKINILMVHRYNCHRQFHDKKSLRNKIVRDRGLDKIFGNDILNK